MIAAKATEKAADAMSKVPEAIDAAVQGLGEKRDSFEKVFTGNNGQNLTSNDLNELEGIDDSTLKDMWDKMGESAKEIWGDLDTFSKDFKERTYAAK
jgi:hypothetical protein